MSDTENEELFTTRMRKATRKIHSISDALVNAKFAISLRDEKVWGGGLFVFYHIFAYLEEAKQRLNMGDFNKLFVHEILERKQAFEEDLKHYLGDDWQSMPKSKELENYLQHLQDLESENPSLLMAYVYHLYLGLLSGGQILAKKRRMFGDSTPETALPETLDETATSSKSACSEASTSAAQGNISAKEKEEFISKDPALKLLEDAVKIASLLEKSDSEKALTLLKTAAELSTAKSISTTAIKLEDTEPKIQSSVSKEWDSMSILQLPIFKKKRHRAMKHLAKKVQVQESVKLKQANEETSAELNTGTNNSAFKEFLKTISSTAVQVENKVPLIPGSVPLEDQISMSRSQIRKIRKFLKRAQSTKTSENASHEETNTAHESVQIEKGSDAAGSVSTDNSKELSEGSLSTAVKMKTIEPTIPIWLTTEEVSLTKPQKRKIRKRKKARKQPTASSSKNGSAEKTEEMNTKELDFNRKLSPASLISAEDRNKLSRAEKHTCSIKERQRIFSNQLIKAGEYAPVGHENNTPFLPIAVRADFIQSVESKEVFYDPSDQSQLAESADKNSEKIFTETSDVLPRYYEPENIPDEEQQIAQLTVGKNENESLGFDAPIISSTAPIISKPKNTGWLPALGDEDQEISYTARKRRRHSSTESLPDSTETQTLNISVKSEFAPREQFLFQSNFPRQTKPSTAKRVVMETVVNEKFSEANERTNFSPNDSSRAYVNRQDCQRLWTNKDRQYPQLGANTNPKEITSTSANEVQQNLQSGANKARDDRQSRAYDYGKRMQNLHNTWSTKNANVCSSSKRKRHIRNPWLEKEKQSGIITDDDLDDACCVAIIKPKNQIFSKAKLASIRSQVGQALNNRNACTGRIPSFRHVITSPRFIKVWCEDYFTVDWLRSVVSSIKDHPQLIVCRQSELLKRIHQISFSVPYEPGQGVTDLMHWIKTENDKWLDVESWTLQRVQRLTTLEDFDWKFYFEISETESENLARLNNYIYYKKRTIKVNTIDTYFEKYHF